MNYLKAAKVGAGSPGAVGLPEWPNCRGVRYGQIESLVLPQLPWCGRFSASVSASTNWRQPRRGAGAVFFNPAELPEGGEGGGGVVAGEFPGEFPAELPWFDRFAELETQVAQLTETVARLVEQIGPTEG
jgi:hypothetical protein